MADGTLRTILEGSLPDEAIEVREARGAFADWRRVEDRAWPVERERRKRSRIRPGHLSQKDFARAVGVHYTTVRNQVRKSEELRAALGLHGRWPTVGLPLSKEQVREAGRILLHAIGIGRWATRPNRDACRVCNTAKYKHHHAGVCTSCAARARRTEWVPWPFRDSWSKKTGDECCRVCFRNDRPHKHHGRCNPCTTWFYREGIHKLKAKGAIERAEVARRRELQARGEANHTRPKVKP